MRLNPISKPLLSVLLALFVLPVVRAADEAPGGAGDEYKIKLSDWSYGRERKTITGSNRVTASITVKNASTQTLHNIKLTLDYYSGLGEKVSAHPIYASAGSLKAGESKKVALAAEFIPIFSAYTITVAYDGGKKEDWRSNSDIASPEPVTHEPLKGIASVAILGQEAGSDRANRFTGIVRVKNEGSIQAKGVKITITFFDAKKKKLGEWSGKLGKGTLAAGAEEKIPFAAARSPAHYNSYRISVGCDEAPAEAALAGGEFSNVKDIEFAHFQFKRASPKSKKLDVAAKVRNGFDAAVEKVRLDMVFLDARKKELKKFSFEVPGQLKPGEIKPVEFSIPELPAYETFEQSVSYNVLDARAPSAPAAVAETPVFKKIKSVEVIFTAAIPGEGQSVSLLGAMRNGKDKPVKDVVVTLAFQMPDGTVKNVAKTLPDLAQPGEERNFPVKALGVAGYKSYTYSINFKEAGAAGQ